MKKSGLFFSVVMYVALTLLISACAGQSQFTPLFNGRNLDNWVEMEKSKGLWSVKDGVMYCKGGGGEWIQTKKKYKDFIMSCEWKVPKDGNSGVFLRIKDDAIDPCWDGIEFQVCDDDGSYKGQSSLKRSGGIYGIAGASKEMYRGVNQWNKYVITCKGTKIKLEYNGEVVLDIDANDYREPFKWGSNLMISLYDRPREGYIGFQCHGSEVWYRNIEIKELR